MSPQRPPPDLLAEAFVLLRGAFFGQSATPLTYRLRDKRNTQDDPLDERISKLLRDGLARGTTCVRAPGPLITPDLVVMRPTLCNGVPRAALASDVIRIVALEVKKLERTKAGGIARPSGMDYNTTPPCGTVRVYDQGAHALDIRGFYLFVCQEAVQGSIGHYRITAFVLCDGNLLNADFAYYLSIIGERTKEIGLGTYGDGANRSRPMLIFANPLGAAELDGKATLVHPRSDLDHQSPQLRHVGLITRTVIAGGQQTFHCYRLRNDVPVGHQDFELVDPFPSPTREVATQPRGRFRLEVRPAD